MAIAKDNIDTSFFVSQTTKPGFVEWLHVGQPLHVERVVCDLKELGITRLRTGFSWADWHTEAGRRWYRWLFPKLASEGIEVLPCLHYTPPSLGIQPASISPPKELKSYADFIDSAIDEFGDFWEYLELWNEPNNLSDWNFHLDPNWELFAEMVGGAAYWAKRRGKKTVLAGMSPVDPLWLNLMGECGILEHFDAIGLHGFPGTWDVGEWKGWQELVRETNRVLEEWTDCKPELWITEVGASTWDGNTRRQEATWEEATAAPVERVYWYSLYDLNPWLPTLEGFEDEKHYHMGLKRYDGSVKGSFWQKKSPAIVAGSERIQSLST